MKTQKITLPKSIQRKWFEVDASKNSLGRVATEIAVILRGKNKRDFTPHMDMGNFVVAVNVNKLKLTGRKIDQKNYYHHSGYIGGLKTTPLKNLMQKNPGDVLKRAVFSMIDDLKFRKKIISRLKLVEGLEHNFKIDKVLN